jgi:hypothetical protein
MRPNFDDIVDTDYWVRTDGASLRDYAVAHLNPELLLGTLEMMRPELVEYRGRVYLKERFDPDNLRRWEDTETFRSGGAAAMQAVVNHVHVSDLIGEARIQLSDHNLGFVTKVIAGSWKACFEDEYPGRDFTVSIDGDEISISEPN